MPKLFFFLILFSLFGCSQENTKKEESLSAEPVKDSVQTISPEEKVISMVDTLQEVASLNILFTNTTKLNPPHLTIWVYARPEEIKISYYWVKVGEDNGLNIATRYNFYVDPAREEILFYDVVNDTLLTLEDWRKK